MLYVTAVKGLFGYCCALHKYIDPLFIFQFLMEQSFRLYNSLHSSFFDLISGDKETQQTKGLGLLLSKSQVALKAFLELPAIKSKVGKINFDQQSKLIVNCELVSQTEKKYRADIVLRFYINDRPWKALLIEAKSINKGTSVYETNKQIENYITKKSFKELGEFGDECYGVTLTKYPSYTKHDNLTSITWSDLIKAFYKARSKKHDLLNDYFSFLTNINGTMKFYEKEVFSIPTAKWSSEAINNFHVYECPNSGKYLIKYKPLFLTFRNSGGGEMEKLYKVDDVIILNFKKDYDTFLNDPNYAPEISGKVKGYVEYLMEKGIWGGLPSDEKQVFILSENAIELKNKPKPAKNNSFRAYYKLADLLNEKILGQDKEFTEDSEKSISEKQEIANR